MSKRNRSRHARRKIRQLVANIPAPIVYSAGDAAAARRLAPADVLATLTFANCTTCRAEVVAHRSAHAHAAALAERSGRRLAILCLACVREVPRDRFTIELHHHDPSLHARLTTWFAEAN